MTRTQNENEDSRVRPLCFIIGPIGGNDTPTRKHSDFLLHAVFKFVLENDEFGYFVKRADEDADPGMIGDRVILDIVQADLVIADLTELNPNAFYELGIRHATEKPTIHVAKAGTALPFDNISHRTIFFDVSDWSNIENGRKKLADTVRAISSPNFRVSNPITQANASFKMKESADPKDQILLQVQERMKSIESKIADQTDFLHGIPVKHAVFSNKTLASSKYVYIETAPLFDLSSQAVINIRVSKDTTVGSFLDKVWEGLYNIDRSIEPYTYGSTWILTNKFGHTFDTNRMSRLPDNRLLEDAGIFAGDTLIASKPAKFSQTIKD